MRNIEPELLSVEGFRPFGEYHRLKTPASLKNLPVFTKKLPLSGPIHFGATSVQGGSFQSKQMERHVLGSEILLCGNETMVLTVADSDPDGVPFAEDVRCFYMQPGDLVVLNKGIWHDANHGESGPLTYFFIAEDTEGKMNRERETQWVPIAPEGVSVFLPQQPRVVECNAQAFSDDGGNFSLGTIKRATDFQSFSSTDGWTGFFDPEKTYFTSPKMAWLPARTQEELYQNPFGPTAILCDCESIDLFAVRLTANVMPNLDSERILLQCGDIVILPKGVCFKLSSSNETGAFLLMENHQDLQRINITMTQEKQHGQTRE